MEGHLGQALAVSNLGTTRSRPWMHRVITLLEAALGQLHDQVEPAKGALLEAASLLRQQIDPPGPQEAPDGRGRLPAWQVRKVRDYIDSHITGPVLVADLCALFRRSEAHFSRSFKRTFGESPHSFVVQRRVELAAQYMLTTDASLIDIALRCGFSDQAHLCKHFRQSAGQTPAAWRRAHRSHQLYRNVVGDPYQSRSASIPSSLKLSVGAAALAARAIASHGPRALMSLLNCPSGDRSAPGAAGCDR
jgi:AraC family transcriptional regulator